MIRKILEILLILLLLLPLGPFNFVFALPVSDGSLPEGVAFNYDGDRLEIIAPDKSVIDYTSFDIAQLESVVFIQDSAATAVLNKVTGGNESVILGSIDAIGKVFLINPNGILFGENARIDTGSFIASTLDMSSKDFKRGLLKFEATNPQDGVSIRNMGEIIAKEGGIVALISPQIDNIGDITADKGKVVLAAADKVILKLMGDRLIKFKLNSKDVRGIINNSGNISADGGEILLTAKSARFAIDSLINNEGRLEANAILNDNGVIRLVNDTGEIKLGGANDMVIDELKAKTLKISADSNDVTYIMNGHLRLKNYCLETGTFISDPKYYRFIVRNDFSIKDGIFRRFRRGSGTETDPYGIVDIYGLQAVKSGLDSSYILLKHINASNTRKWNGGLGFEPIGYSYDNSFTGNFNGNNFMIKKLSINRPDQDYVGLFGYTKSALIENTGLKRINVIGKNKVGGLVGEADIESYIKNSYVIGNVKGEFNVGGLVGDHNFHSTIEKSYARGKVTGTENVGGLVGHNDTSTIIKSHARSTVKGEEMIGGLVGFSAWNAVINKSYAVSKVDGISAVGGLVGTNFAGSIIENSYARSKVNADSWAGGLVGLNYYNAGIANSRSYGTVTGTQGIGGFIGYNALGCSVTNSKSKTKVKGDLYVGGFTGYDTGDNTYSKNAWYSRRAKLPKNTDIGNLGDIEGIKDYNSR